MSSVKHIGSEEEWNSTLEAADDKLVVVDFFATWCGPCRAMSPKIEELAKKYPDVVFLKVNVEECKSIATRLQVFYLPTFCFMRTGIQVDECVGANPKKLAALVDENIKIRKTQPYVKKGISSAAGLRTILPYIAAIVGIILLVHFINVQGQN